VCIDASSYIKYSFCCLITRLIEIQILAANSNYYYFFNFGLELVHFTLSAAVCLVPPADVAAAVLACVFLLCCG